MEEVKSKSTARFKWGCAMHASEIAENFVFATTIAIVTQRTHSTQLGHIATIMQR
jgi:hypothetical protein